MKRYISRTLLSLGLGVLSGTMTTQVVQGTPIDLEGVERRSNPFFDTSTLPSDSPRPSPGFPAIAPPLLPNPTAPAGFSPSTDAAAPLNPPLTPQPIPSSSQQTHGALDALEYLPEFLVPQYPSFNSQLLDQQLTLYSLQLFLSGPPDVLIVGSSRAIQGIDPTQLRTTLVERGLPALRIYNFSINGATAQVVHLLLTQILTPEQLPKLVIWGDGSRAFNSGRLDRTYEQITSSPGFQSLQNGQPLIPYGQTPPARPRTCQDVPPTPLRVSQQWVEAGDRPRQGPQMSVQIMEAIAAVWQKVVPLARSQPALSPCYASPSTSDPASLPQPFAQSSPEPNWFMGTEHLPFFPGFYLPFDIDSTGFLSNRSEFDPASYYQTYPYVSGAYDASYVPFSLAGPQTEATLEVAQYLAEQDIPLVFANLPLTEGYLDEVRSRYEAEFVTYLTNLSASINLTLVDLNQPSLSKNHYFADPSHLNATGAKVVAQALGQNIRIPWPTSH